MYPPPVTARAEASPDAETTADRSVTEGFVLDGRTTGISPLTNPRHRRDQPSDGRRRVVLVEDRLAADRRTMPAPPSHRARQQSGNGNSPGAAGAAVLDRVPADRQEHIGLDPSRPPVLRQDQTTTEGQPDLAPHRRLVESDDDIDGQLSLSRRIIRGGLVLGLIAAIGALMVIMPDDNGPTAVETASGEDGSGEETESPAPVATAEMLDDATLPEVEVSLGSTESLSKIALSGFVVRSGSPADTAEGFDAAVSEMVDELAEPEPTTATTVWVEPQLPPAAEWIDSGNGVAVPDLLLRIRFCESTNNYNAANGVSSARGAYQFLTKSWDWYGHAEITGVSQAHLATPAQQDEAALRTLQAEGTGPWAESRDCWNDPDIDPRYRSALPVQPTTTVPATDPDDGESTDSTDGTDTTAVDGESSTTTTAPESPPDGESGDTTEPSTTTTTVPEPDNGGTEDTTPDSTP